MIETYNHRADIFVEEAGSGPHRLLGQTLHRRSVVGHQLGLGAEGLKIAGAVLKHNQRRNALSNTPNVVDAGFCGSHSLFNRLDIVGGGGCETAASADHNNFPVRGGSCIQVRFQVHVVV